MASQMSLFDELLESPSAKVATPPIVVSPKTTVAKAVESQVNHTPVKKLRKLFELTDSMLPKGDIARIEANLKAIEIVNEVGQLRPSIEQRNEIAAYTGWGSLSSVFDEDNRKTSKYRERLLKLVGLEKYESLRESVLTAYYTSPAICRSIWSVVQAMGFKGGRVLEPSCGSGNFVGTMPTEMRQDSRITGIELDSETVRIARRLYADDETSFQGVGIEKAYLEPNHFDLVIGNVPFGEFRVTDKRFDYLKMPIHDYFIAKSIDLVRPGGIVAVITSTGTMDKTGKKAREYFAEQAVLVKAIRLPGGAFLDAGTNVDTDVLIFQKKLKPSSDNQSFIEAKYIQQPHQVNSDDYRVRNESLNGYFWQNPEGLMLGDLGVRHTQYGNSLTLIKHDNWLQKLDGISLDPTIEGLYKPIERIERDVSMEAYGMPQGYVLSDDGELQYADGYKLEAQTQLPATSKVRITGMVRIRDATLDLIETEALGLDGAEKRSILNRVYDEFVKQYGYLMRPVNRRLFSIDSRAALLWALEIYDEELEQAVKAELFERKTIGSAELSETAHSMGDAITLSYNRHGKINIGTMAKSLSREYEDVLDELQVMGRVFKDPASGEFVDSEVYLSGDVRRKYKVAKAALEGGGDFIKNVESLTAVMPDVVRLKDVNIKMGVPWIPAADVEAFVDEVVLERSNDNTVHGRIRVDQMPGLSIWNVSSSLGKNYQLFKTKWGTERTPFADLLETLLNQRQPDVFDEIEVDGGKTKRVINREETVASREKAEFIQEQFAKWVLTNDDRVKRLEEVYNDTYNGIVNRKYEGSHLVIPGLSSAISLRDAQKDSVWRGIASGNTLYALAVGGGKTLIQICVSQELKRLGLASKPMLVVPNHMLEAFAGEYLRAFPRAKVLAASKQDLEGDKRRVLLSRIATGNWDCVIITHSSFGKIAISEDYTKSFIDEVKSAAGENAKGVDDQNMVRAIERTKKSVVAKLENLAARGEKDKSIVTFDKLGIDLITVDEADLFKNLWFFTRKTRVSGINTAFSGRALDLFMKSRCVFDARGDDGYGLNFATATPISNSICELFVMQTYLQQSALRRAGLHNFDAWASNFAREVTSIEVKPEGSGFRMHTRFAQFVNVPELMLLFREVAEIRTKSMLNLPIPKLAGGAHTIIPCEPTGAQKAFVDELVMRAERIRGGSVRPAEDNMLLVTGDGRKAALDMQLISPEHAPTNQGKVAACVERIIHHYNDGLMGKLTQMVFSDIGTPRKGGYSVYGDLKARLIAAGVDESDIAFAQDYDTDAKKASLHRMVRQGKIRILIGSTELMGFGTNVQDLLVAEHHLDAPWRPRDVEQRDGRIERQGNKNEMIHIYRYVTQGTFDAYMWQTLERKAVFIAQVMSGETKARTVEDVTSQSLSYAEVKALASGNPLVIEKAGIDAEVSKLSAIWSTWSNAKAQASRRIESAKFSKSYRETTLALLTEVEKLGTKVSGVEVNGKAMAQAIVNAKAEVIAGKVRGQTYDTGILAGGMKLNVWNEGTVKDPSFRYSLKYRKPGTNSYDDAFEFEVKVPHGADNLEQMVTNDSLGIQFRAEIDATRAKIQLFAEEIEGLLKTIDLPFEYAERLQIALDRQAEIDSRLEVNSNDNAALALASEEEVA